MSCSDTRSENATPSPARDRRILLEGGVNFRDFGGYPTSDGKTVRRKMLFRSGALDRLTAADVEKVSQLGLSHIVDFRDPNEAMQRPNVIIPGVASDLVPANPPCHSGASLRQLAAGALAGGDPVTFMQKLYRKLPFENQAYRHTMAVLQRENSGGVLIHCMLGKDRTGVGAMVVQLALGVERDAIVADYLLTESELANFKERAIAEFVSEFSMDEVEGMKVLMSARAEFIDAALGAIFTRFGDAEKYLEFEFGLTAERLEKLRAQYLR